MTQDTENNPSCLSTDGQPSESPGDTILKAMVTHDIVMIEMTMEELRYLQRRLREDLEALDRLRNSG